MSPEVLTNRVNNEYKKKVDVYSFGIIMHEVFFELLPYQSNSDQFDNIVALGTSVVNGLRPDIPQIQGLGNAEKRYLKLMQKCWSEDPSERPDFEEIYAQMIKMG
jgi:serine/threonine protein kinase